MTSYMLLNHLFNVMSYAMQSKDCWLSQGFGRASISGSLFCTPRPHAHGITRAAGLEYTKKITYLKAGDKRFDNTNAPDFTAALKQPDFKDSLVISEVLSHKLSSASTELLI